MPIRDNLQRLKRKAAHATSELREVEARVQRRQTCARPRKLRRQVAKTLSLPTDMKCPCCQKVETRLNMWTRRPVPPDVREQCCYTSDTLLLCVTCWRRAGNVARFPNGVPWWQLFGLPFDPIKEGRRPNQCVMGDGI